MRSRFLLFFFLTGNLFANELCRYINHELGKSDMEWLKHDTEKALVHQIVSIVKQRASDLAAQKAKDTGKKAGYGNLVEVADPNGADPTKTVHSLESKNLGGDPPVSDSRFVINLPHKGEKTVWELLTPAGRKMLAEQLADEFKQGNYDDVIPEAGRGNPLAQALRETEFNHVVDDKSFPVAGLSPLLVLNAANKRRPVGVCRHGNCAMVGLLGELGIPEADIRMVSGKQKPKDETGHVWVEIRTSPDGPWMEIEATGQRLSGEDRLMSAILGAKKSNNRAKYTHDVKVWDEVLVPHDIKPADLADEP